MKLSLKRGGLVRRMTGGEWNSAQQEKRRKAETEKGSGRKKGGMNSKSATKRDAERFGRERRMVDCSADLLIIKLKFN